MSGTVSVTAQKDGLTLKIYHGAGAVLLALDLDPHLTDGLAGFSISRQGPNDTVPYFLPNRLSFETHFTNATTAKERTLFPSNIAPFQKYRWIDFPSAVQEGAYTYTAGAVYFADPHADPPTLEETPRFQVSATIGLIADDFSNFRFGFTRGYLSSQAYTAHFHDANGNPLEYRPAEKSLDFDYASYEKQYQWLGGEARRLVFSFLQECVDDPSASVDMFAYDLDEPKIVQMMVQLGNRLRLVQDNASLHTGKSALEPTAVDRIRDACGQIVLGKFWRFAHDKVIIKKDASGKAQKVLTGSANFSIRGLYVQSNNVLVFDDATVAGYYEQAFEQAFTNMGGFKASPIAQHWFDIGEPGVPPCSVSFSPHADPMISLGRVDQAVRGAQSSVLYAVMTFGSGAVTDDLKALGSRDDLYSFGVTETTKGLDIYRPGSSNGELVPFGFLAKQVPPPFDKELSGKELTKGMGQTIHDKFIVVDFNDNTPVVFTGSSNLSAGGETDNGDNLLAISDVGVVTAYAVEAVRMFDHYRFRQAMQNATDVQPLSLKATDWWQDYYDEKNIKCRERSLFVR